MKASCLQENLSRGLSVTRRAVAARPALPALSHVLLATDRSRLKLMATDLELSIVCWIGASVTSEGSVAVPARLLTDLIDSWPAERVDTVLEQGTLHLSCGASQAAIKGIDVQQFPLISSSPDDVQVRIAPRLLREIISQVIFAAATEESRPILTGVLVRFDDDLLTMVAGDGFRLSIRQVRFPQAFDNPIEIIIPARALNELVRIIGDEEEPIGIHINPTRSQVLFQLQGSARAREGRIFSIELTSQLIEGRHIDYHRVLPRSHTTRTILDTERFLKACKTASIFARNETNDVCLTVVPGDGVGTGLVRVTAISTDIGDSADELRASVEGEPITIGFDVRYLMDALSVMNSGQVVLETTGLTTPAVIRPLGSDDFVHVLAPMVTHRLR